jgi:ribosome-binding factor A
MQRRPSRRSHKIAELIQHCVAPALRQKVADPRLQNITVTAVAMSPDLKYADIFFTSPEGESLDEISKALVKAQGFLRSLVASESDLKYVPILKFKYDRVLAKASKIDAILDGPIISMLKPDLSGQTAIEEE